MQDSIDSLRRFRSCRQETASSERCRPPAFSVMGSPLRRKTFEHRRIVAKHVRLELRDAIAASDVHQLPKQLTCDAAALVVLFHRERNLCARFTPRAVTQTNDDFLIAACDRGNQDNVAYAVALGEPPEFLAAQLAFENEEPLVDRFRLQRPKRLHDAFPVVGADGADRYAAQVRTTSHAEAFSRARAIQRTSRLTTISGQGVRLQMTVLVSMVVAYGPMSSEVRDERRFAAHARMWRPPSM